LEDGFVNPGVFFMLGALDPFIPAAIILFLSARVSLAVGTLLTPAEFIGPRTQDSAVEAFYL
jgi:hypothetical protein